VNADGAQPLPGIGASFLSDYASEGTPWESSVVFSAGLNDAIASDGAIDAAYIYRKQIAVRICVNFLAQAIAHTKLKVHRRQADQSRPPLDDHPLAKLLERPNPQTTGFDLIHATVSDLGLYENAFWIKVQGSDGLQLHRIPPAYMTVKGGSIITGPASYEVDVRNGKPPRSFAPDEVVHIHGYDPLDTRVGQSRLHPLTMVLREESEATRWRAKFWRKGARMDGLLKRPAEAGNWDETAFKRFREGWRRFVRGGDLEGETPVLEDGMDYQPTSFSPKDAEFIAGREWALDVVATAYHIPLAMLSRKGSATFASLKEFHKILYVDVLGPWNAMIEKALWLQLLPEFGEPDLYVEFNIDEKLQGDFEQQAQAARQSVQVPWQSPNDIRALRGMAPIGDPDDEENPYNWPARPKAYEYGPQVQLDETETTPGIADQPAPGQANGHGQLRIDELAELAEALEGP